MLCLDSSLLKKVLTNKLTIYLTSKNELGYFMNMTEEQKSILKIMDHLINLNQRLLKMEIFFQKFEILHLENVQRELREEGESDEQC